ncbi:MAG: ion channel, partial [Cyanobacteria bacterium P01_C01_bin.89]
TFLSTPFLNHGLGEILSGLMLFYTLIAILRTIELPRKLLSVYIVVAVLAFSLQILAILNVFPTFYRGLGMIIEGIYALYLGGAAYWISRDILENPKASLDTVRGGVSVYLLLGFVWALLYGMVSLADNNAFSPSLRLDDSLLTAMHFSFTTLTTLGYGDIVPKSPLALVLTNLEAIAGQMYSTIFIAILVGGYLARRP